VNQRAANNGKFGMFYGWVVVTAAFVVMFVGFGCAYSFTTFFPELQREFSASRATISMVFSLAAFLYFGLGALSGALADRVGPRWVSVGGMVALGAGLAVASTAQSFSMVYAGLALGIGVGVGFSYVPSIGAVQPWFSANRGLASGIAVSGIGLGTLLGPVYAAYFIPIVGWRETLWTMGIVAMGVGIAASLFLDNDPAAHAVRKRRVNDDEGLGQGNGGSVAAAWGLGVSQALRTRPFWLLYFGAIFLSFGIFIPFVHIVPYALDQGFTAADGAYVLGVIGIGSTVGRFAIGGLADRMGRHNALLGAYVGITAMQFLWLGSDALWMLYVFALIFGSCYGAFVALAPAVCADYFGTRAAGGVIGALYTSVGIGTLIGPSFAGWVYDQVGGYAGAIVFGEAMAAIGVGLTLLLPPPAKWRAGIGAV
jgi:OFA family oxalate/formate antiporter-like MFS transporter